MTRCIECQTRATADALGNQAPTVATLQRALQLAGRRIARLTIEAAERDPLLRATIERNRELEDICARLNARLARKAHK